MLIHYNCTSLLFVSYVFLFQLSSAAWLVKLGIKLPINLDLDKYKGQFQFIKPAGVVVIGSYAAECRLGPNIEIDIKVEIPQV